MIQAEEKRIAVAAPRRSVFQLEFVSENQQLPASFFSFNKIIITPLVQGVTEVFMYYLCYFCGTQKILLWITMDYLDSNAVSFHCFINVHNKCSLYRQKSNSFSLDN